MFKKNDCKLFYLSLVKISTIINFEVQQKN